MADQVPKPGEGTQQYWEQFLNFRLNVSGDDTFRKAFQKVGEDIRGVQRDFTSLGKTTDTITRGISNLGNSILGAFGVSSSLSIGRLVGEVVNFNKGLLNLRPSVARYGSDINKLESSLASIRKQFKFTREQSLSLANSFVKGFDYAPIQRMEGFFSLLSDSVGNNVDAMNELQSMIQGVSKQSIIFSQVFTQVKNEKKKFDAQMADTAGIMLFSQALTGKIDIRTYSEMASILETARQTSLGINTADAQRKKQIQDQINMLNQVSSTWDQIKAQVGQALLPLMMKFSNFIKNHEDGLVKVGSEVLKIAKYAGLVAGAFATIKLGKSVTDAIQMFGGNWGNSLSNLGGKLNGSRLPRKGSPASKVGESLVAGVTGQGSPVPVIIVGFANGVGFPGMTRKLPRLDYLDKVENGARTYQRTTVGRLAESGLYSSRRSRINRINRIRNARGQKPLFASRMTALGRRGMLGGGFGVELKSLLGDVGDWKDKSVNIFKEMSFSIKNVFGKYFSSFPKFVSGLSSLFKGIPSFLTSLPGWGLKGIGGITGLAGKAIGGLGTAATKVLPGVTGGLIAGELYRNLMPESVQKSGFMQSGQGTFGEGVSAMTGGLIAGGPYGAIVAGSAEAYRIYEEGQGIYKEAKELQKKQETEFDAYKQSQMAKEEKLPEKDRVRTIALKLQAEKNEIQKQIDEMSMGTWFNIKSRIGISDEEMDKLKAKLAEKQEEYNKFFASQQSVNEKGEAQNNLGQQNKIVEAEKKQNEEYNKRAELARNILEINTKLLVKQKAIEEVMEAQVRLLETQSTLFDQNIKLSSLAEMKLRPTDIGGNALQAYQSQLSNINQSRQSVSKAIENIELIQSEFVKLQKFAEDNKVTNEMFEVDPKKRDESAKIVEDQKQRVKNAIDSLKEKGITLDIDLDVGDMGLQKATLEFLSKKNELLSKGKALDIQAVELAEKANQKFGPALEYQQTMVDRTQTLINLYDNFGMGLSASVAQRMQLIQSLQKEQDLLKSQLGTQLEIAQSLDESAAVKQKELMLATNDEEKKTINDEILKIEAQKNDALLRQSKIQNQIYQNIAKQAEQSKIMREGYISAINAMNTGSGVFKKIVIDQNTNLGVLMRQFKGVPTGLRTGQASNRFAGIGLTQSSRWTENGLSGPAESLEANQARLLSVPIANVVNGLNPAQLQQSLAGMMQFINKYNPESQAFANTTGVQQQMMGTGEYASNFGSVLKNIRKLSSKALSQITSKSSATMNQAIMDVSAGKTPDLTNIGQQEAVDFTKNLVAIMSQSNAESKTSNESLDKVIERLTSIHSILSDKDRIFKVISISEAATVAQPLNSGGIAFNQDGKIPGRGPNKDSVPAILTKGEYVIKRDAVDYYGDSLLHSLNNKNLPKNRLNAGGFAVDDFAVSSEDSKPYDHEEFMRQMNARMVADKVGSTINAVKVMAQMGNNKKESNTYNHEKFMQQMNDRIAVDKSTRSNEVESAYNRIVSPQQESFANNSVKVAENNSVGYSEETQNRMNEATAKISTHNNIERDLVKKLNSTNDARTIRNIAIQRKQNRVNGQKARNELRLLKRQRISFVENVENADTNVINKKESSFLSNTPIDTKINTHGILIIPDKDRMQPQEGKFAKDQKQRYNQTMYLSQMEAYCENMNNAINEEYNIKKNYIKSNGGDEKSLNKWYQSSLDKTNFLLEHYKDVKSKILDKSLTVDDVDREINQIHSIAKRDIGVTDDYGAYANYRAGEFKDTHNFTDNNKKYIGYQREKSYNLLRKQNIKKASEEEYKKSFAYALSKSLRLKNEGGSIGDKNPALLSDGEFVMRSKAVEEYGLDFMKQINEGKKVKKFSRGGLVGSSFDKDSTSAGNNFVSTGSDNVQGRQKVEVDVELSKSQVREIRDRLVDDFSNAMKKVVDEAANRLVLDLTRGR